MLDPDDTDALVPNCWFSITHSTAIALGQIGMNVIAAHFPLPYYLFFRSA